MVSGQSEAENLRQRGQKLVYGLDDLDILPMCPQKMQRFALLPLIFSRNKCVGYYCIVCN